MRVLYHDPNRAACRGRGKRARPHLDAVRRLLARIRFRLAPRAPDAGDAAPDRRARAWAHEAKRLSRSIRRAGRWSTRRRWCARSRKGRIAGAGLDVFEHEPRAAPRSCSTMANVVRDTARRQRRKRSCAQGWRTSSSTTSWRCSKAGGRRTAGTPKSTRRSDSQLKDAMADKAKVVLTDYVWESLEVEKKTLAGLAELVPLQTKKPEEFIEQAADCDALLNTYAGPDHRGGHGEDAEVQDHRALRHRRGHDRPRRRDCRPASSSPTTRPTASRKSPSTRWRSSSPPRERSCSTTGRCERDAGQCRPVNRSSGSPAARSGSSVSATSRVRSRYARPRSA